MRLRYLSSRCAVGYIRFLFDRDIYCRSWARKEIKYYMFLVAFGKHNKSIYKNASIAWDRLAV